MDRIFSYRASRHGKLVSEFRAICGGLSALLLAIGDASTETNATVKNGCIYVPLANADEIARHCIRSGWSLGV